LCYNGPAYLAGYTPTGPHSLYAHLSEQARDLPPGPERMVAEMRELAASYGGFWEEIRKDIADPARINYTVIESILVGQQWNRGRVVIVGDAAHACPPSLALGAAMGREDAAVLAELLTRYERLDQSLFDTFMDRRYERVRLVVNSSLQLAHWQRVRAQAPDVGGLMAKVNQVVGRPC
jgi:2-polyprenyl-6-methoxyphenol hydroxylase-like FAD-dependent oxidoreductase